MKKSFLLLGLLASSISWGSCLKDVEGSFNRIGENVTPLSVWTHDFISSNMYMQKLSNKIGLNTHFQGLVRIPGSSKFVMSGGDFYSRTGNLFVIDFASQEGKELLEKNFSDDDTKTASEEDKFIQNVIAGSKNSWHVGGLGIMENILAVPVENALAGSSVVDFYDLSNPENPVKLDISIIRPGFKTGSVIIFRNSENKIIVGANSDQLKLMEFFQSKTTNIQDGFEEKTRAVEMQANGQGSVVLNQCDGKKFLIDFNNTSPVAPIIWGKDYVRLYSFNETTFRIELIGKRTFKTKRFCNFKASGTATITESGKLAIYGSHFYRHGKGKRVKLCQFSE